jgi:hypothetical protein
MKKPDHLCRIRFWLATMIVGLVLSGVTAFPLETELHWLVSVLRTSPFQDAAQSFGLLQWIGRVSNALTTTNAQYPFLAYGTDWLAFAHLAIAVVFIGPCIDPVRNKWIITFGLIACAGVIPIAWLLDCSFGVFGAVPLLFCRRSIVALEGTQI